MVDVVLGDSVLDHLWVVVQVGGPHPAVHDVRLHLHSLQPSIVTDGVFVCGKLRAKEQITSRPVK